MLETISAAGLSSVQRTPLSTTPEDEQQLSFNFALAAIGLQEKAATALQAHGATPQDNALLKNTADQSASAPPRAQSGRAEGPVSDVATPNIKNHSATVSAQHLNGAHIPTEPIGTNQLSLPLVQTPTSAPAGVSPTILHATSQGSQSPIGPRDNAVFKDATALAKKNPTFKTSTPQQASQTTEVFARLLAKKLDSGSSFDIRLDPPSLGRVEGRFAISQDGKSVLALSFDNQAALDLFKNDELALRTALTDSGIDLGQSDISFSMSMNSPDQDAIPRRFPTDAIAEATAREAQSLHMGAIDLKV